MWLTSDAYATALVAGSRHWSTKVEVLYSDAVVTTLTVVTDGAVDVDEVAVRRSLNLTMVDPDGTLTPADARDLLAPKGTEVRVYKGLDVTPGVPEWVPLGVFGIVQPVISAHGPGTLIKVKAFDRVDAVRKRRFDTPWSIAAGTPTFQAITDIVTSRLTVPVRVTTTGSTTPEVVYDELSDPWDAVRAIASADSLVAFFDPLGTLVVAPDAEMETGMEYAPGAQSLLMKNERTMSSDTTYSGVIVKGEHPDKTPVRSVLWDTDPKSPTYSLGPFGKRPYGFSSPLITTQDMADTAAATILPRVSKMRQEVVLDTIGHPGHEIGDVVTITDPKSRTAGRYTVYGGKIPLRIGGIQWKLRASLT
jgi:Domain of unknown function (DUF5047)